MMRSEMSLLIADREILENDAVYILKRKEADD
jgi:hypothetical protein